MNPTMATPLLTPRGGGDALSAIEREAKRVAHAFGVEEWGPHAFRHGFLGMAGNVRIGWIIDKEKGTLKGVEVGLHEEPSTTLLRRSNGTWGIALYPGLTDELMAWGLYRLGFQDKAVLSQLPSLSAHERMEARLSLPREFWPVTWLEEEKTVMEYQSET